MYTGFYEYCYKQCENKREFNNPEYKHDGDVPCADKNPGASNILSWNASSHIPMQTPGLFAKVISIASIQPITTQCRILTN